MAWRIVLLLAATLALAPAMRVSEPDFPTDKELLRSLNETLADSLAENREEGESGAVVAATWAAFNLAYDLYEAYEKTKDAWESYKQRKEAVDAIVKGHTAGVGLAVKAAHTELGTVKGGHEELEAVIKGDTFNHFKDLLFTFETAQQMCVHEYEFFKDPVAWFTRFFGKRPSEKDVKHLDRAKVVIDEVVKSLQGVIDEGVCPQLKRVVKQDLLVAQQRVEEWEKTVMDLTGGRPTSYYEMMYEKYASTEDGNGMSHWLMDVGTKVMDEASKLSRKSVYPERKKCYRTAGGQGGNDLWDREYDKFEIVFDDSMSDKDRLEMGNRLRNSSTEANLALDRASMNMEMFQRECGRVAPDGRETLIKELEDEAAAGDENAAKMFTAVTCDFCMRYGCRELGVLEVLHYAYGVARYGVDKMLLFLAKGLLPKWVQQILKTVSAVEDVLHPAGDHAVEFYCSVVFLFAKGAEQFKVGETCIEMGLVLEKDRSVRATLGDLAKGITPMSKPSSTGKLPQKL